MVGHIQERIKQLERDDAHEARDIKALLNKEQQQVLQDAWTKKQALRKNTSHQKQHTHKNFQLCCISLIRKETKTVNQS
jgi:hypothetical protein